jgi:hypothetical protein
MSGNSRRKGEMIQVAHENAHFGQQSMFMQILHNGYWWPHIRDEIRAETNHCLPCQRINIHRQGYRPLRSIKTHGSCPGGPHCGLPTSKEGKTAIPVSKDLHTGYIWLYTSKWRLLLCRSTVNLGL